MHYVLLQGSMSSEKRQKMTFSAFGHLKPVPTDEIFHLKTVYANDTHPSKVDLGIGGKCYYGYQVIVQICDMNN